MSFLSQVNLILEKVGSYKPINLPYKLNALEPVVNKQTTDFHFNKHYKGYVKKLNAAMGGRRKIPLVELVKNINSYNDKVDRLGLINTSSKSYLSSVSIRMPI